MPTQDEIRGETPPKKRVLIADDSPLMRTIVRTTIASDAYDVLEAGSGDEALALVREHRPHLALLDLVMPGLDGLQVARTIRADPALQDVRVILLTSRDNATDRAAGVAAGVDQYLTKPFSPLELLQTV